MENKKVALDNPVTIAGITVIPVVEVLLNHWHRDKISSFSAIKRPIAVVVISPTTKRAMRITGEEISVNQLLEEVPGVKDKLTPFLTHCQI